MKRPVPTAGYVFGKHTMQFGGELANVNIQFGIDGKHTVPLTLCHTVYASISLCPSELSCLLIVAIQTLSPSPLNIQSV